MTITLTAAELIPLLLGLAALFLGALKFFLDRYLEQIDKRYGEIADAIREETADRRRLQEEMMRFKADLPIHYVRREDDIRNQATINAKLDALYMKIEGLRENTK